MQRAAVARALPVGARSIESPPSASRARPIPSRCFPFGNSESLPHAGGACPLTPRPVIGVRPNQRWPAPAGARPNESLPQFHCPPAGARPPLGRTSPSHLSPMPSHFLLGHLPPAVGGANLSHPPATPAQTNVGRLAPVHERCLPSHTSVPSHQPWPG